MKFEAINIEGNYEVRTQIGGVWFTIADTYAVDGIGSSEDTAKLIADLLNTMSIFKNK